MIKFIFYKIKKIRIWKFIMIKLNLIFNQKNKLQSI